MVSKMQKKWVYLQYGKEATQLQKFTKEGGRWGEGRERERKPVLNLLALTAEKQLSFSSFFSYIGDL